MERVRRKIQYQSTTDESSSNLDNDNLETESEDIHVKSDPIIRQNAVKDDERLDRARTWPNKAATPPGNVQTASPSELTKKEKIVKEAEKLAHRAKETGEQVGASIRARSVSAGKSIRKRSRSAGRAVKAASITAGKSIRRRSVSAGKSIGERSVSAGKKMRERSISAGKVIREKSVLTGEKIKSGSKTAGKRMKKGSVAAGRKIRSGSVSAGKKMKAGSRVAGRKMREAGKSAGSQIRERSQSLVENVRRSRERRSRTTSGGETEEEEEEEEGMEREERRSLTERKYPRGVMKKSPEMSLDHNTSASSKSRLSDRWQRNRTKTRVKFENVKMSVSRKLGRMPRPQCVRPAIEDDDDDEEGTQVEVFEIPGRSAANEPSFVSPPRLVYKDCNSPNHYFTVMRDGKEIRTPEEEEEEEEGQEGDDDDEDYHSPMAAQEREEEMENGRKVKAKKEKLVGGMKDEEEEVDEEEDEDEEEERDEEDEKEMTPPDPTIAIEETTRDEVLGAEFVVARDAVFRYRLHLKRVSSAVDQSLRRGPRIGGRLDSLKTTFKGRKLGQANDRRMAKSFAKFAEAVPNPATETTLKDTGHCFGRSAEILDELESSILSQFSLPLKTFLETDAKSLMKREKNLLKLADKIVLAKSEGVITQRSFDDLHFRFTNKREELLRSYSVILEREDDQAERLADIAKAYTKYHDDNQLVFNAALDTLKRNLAQLENVASADAETRAAASDAGFTNNPAASKTSGFPTMATPLLAYGAGTNGVGLESLGDYSAISGAAPKTSTTMGPGALGDYGGLTAMLAV